MNHCTKERDTNNEVMSDGGTRKRKKERRKSRKPLPERIYRAQFLLRVPASLGLAMTVAPAFEIHETRIEMRDRDDRDDRDDREKFICG